MTRGIPDERRLVRLLWKSGFAVIRSPASGSATRMPRPDIIAGHSGKGLQFAIEVKTTHNKTLYIPHESITQLIDFSHRFGCQPIIAIKFKDRNRSWLFLRPQQLGITPASNFKITLVAALREGMDFKALMKEDT